MRGGDRAVPAGLFDGHSQLAIAQPSTPKARAHYRIPEEPHHEMVHLRTWGFEDIAIGGWGRVEWMATAPSP
jgi:hypothetical protein